MDSFHKAKKVRLFNHHLNKFLYAHEDEKSIILNPHVVSDSDSKPDHWTVEFCPDHNTIRLKSCHGTYLTTSDVTRCCHGVKKVIQTKVVHRGNHLDSSVEWEPVAAEGELVMLRTLDGKFLQANRSIVPWRDSVSCTIPRQEAMDDSILWSVEWMDIITTYK